MFVKRLADLDCIPAGETHEVKNLGNAVATMLVVMTCPAAAQ
jgi:hypothetical protein